VSIIYRVYGYFSKLELKKFSKCSQYIDQWKKYNLIRPHFINSDISIWKVFNNQTFLSLIDKFTLLPF